MRGMGENIEFQIPNNWRELKAQIRSAMWVAIGILVIIAGYTSFYTVQADSQGIVLRFGKHVDIVDPGLRFKLPFGIDTVEIVQVEKQLKQEYGFATRGATNPTQFSPSSAERDNERNMVTGDLNSATVEWSIQYRIQDPVQFLFKVRQPEVTMRDISESAMRTVVGDRTVDEVLTVGRQEIEHEARTLMQALADRYELGLWVELVQLNNVNPPREVKASFDEVNRAQQEKEQMINVANGEYNKVIPRARGEADQRLQAAEGYRLKRVNEAEGDVSRFNALLEEYIKAPEVTKRRLYLETMGAVIPNLGKKIVIDSDAQQILPLLQLNEETQAR